MPIHRIDAGETPVFITQVTSMRRAIFSDPGMLDLLRTTLRTVKQLHPFVMLAYVFLPNHFHILIRCTPPTTHVVVMHSLKSYMVYAVRSASGGTATDGIWQRRYWDHAIRDQDDLNRHLDYIHYNPVRHGLAATPEMWSASSYCEWVRRGYYETGWGHALPEYLHGFALDCAGEAEFEE